MNEKIMEIVDQLFQDVAESEESLALHEELMNNCQEHYQDLVKGGLTEEEACSAVAESLNGMQELIDSYPKKSEIGSADQDSPETEKLTDESLTDKAEQDEVPNEELFFADSIHRIQVESGAHDVVVSLTEGNQIRVSCETMQNLHIDQEEDCLVIRAVRLEEDVSKAAEGLKIDKEVSLSELLHQVAQFIGKAAKNVMSRIEDQGFFDDEPIEIQIPKGYQPLLELTSKSGDILVDGIVSEEITVRSASGDVKYRSGEEKATGRINLSSLSGDVSVDHAWIQEGEISSISGDVEAEGDFGILNCKSISGDVEFNGTAAMLGAKSVSGDASINFVQADCLEMHAETTSGEITVHLPDDHGAVHTESSTVSGTISIAVPDAGEGAPVQFRLKSISGNIYVREI